MNKFDFDEIDRRFQEAAIEDGELLHDDAILYLPPGTCGHCQFWNSGYCMLFKIDGCSIRKPGCEMFR